MKDLWQSVEIFSSATSAIVIAVLACIAKQAHHGWKGARTFLRELIVCIFVGMILGWGLEGSGYSQGLQNAIIAGGSFSAGTLIDPLFKKLLALIDEFNLNWKWPGSNRKDDD